MTEDDPFDELEPLAADADGAAADVDELFSEVPVEDVDEEAVWAELTADATADGPADGNGAGVEDADDEPPVTDEDGVVVPKASYCQQCEHFSAPPEMACGNPGTDIVELVDVDHVLVRDCPVAERRLSASRNLGDGE